MSKMKFESALRHKEEAFIKFKKDFGHAYGSQTYHLLDFDRFCLAEYPHKDTLTEEMVMRWSVIKETETSNRNRRAFMCVGAVQAVSFSGWDVREL